MNKKFGFEGWKAIAEIFCGLMLVFSFIGKNELGFLYYPTLVLNIFIVLFSTINMIIAKYKGEN
jgi:hypothetical protein